MYSTWKIKQNILYGVIKESLKYSQTILTPVKYPKQIFGVKSSRMKLEGTIKSGGKSKKEVF